MRASEGEEKYCQKGTERRIYNPTHRTKAEEWTLKSFYAFLAFWMVTVAEIPSFLLSLARTAAAAKNIITLNSLRILAAAYFRGSASSFFLPFRVIMAAAAFFIPDPPPSARESVRKTPSQSYNTNKLVVVDGMYKETCTERKSLHHKAAAAAKEVGGLKATPWWLDNSIKNARRKYLLIRICHYYPRGSREAKCRDRNTSNS